jgi:uncharacterized membrane protein YeiB
VPETRRRPTGLAERVLAPDLARGVMLLFIALADSHHFLRGERYLVGFPLAELLRRRLTYGRVPTNGAFAG